jgi:hypothetical protein
MRNAGIERGGGYVEQLLARNPYQMELGRINVLDFIRRIADNFLYYAFRVLPSILLPVLRAEILLTIIGAIFTILTFIGFITRINRRSVFEMYFVFAIIVLLAWPYVWASDRFLLPVFPIFVIYIYCGVLWVKDKINFRRLVPAFAGIIILLNIIAIRPLVQQTVKWNAAYLKGDRYAGYGLDWRRYFEIVEWTRAHIPHGNLIMARKPEFVYLLAGHKSIIYPFTTDHAPIREAIKKCDYIILDNFFWTATSAFYLFPVIEETPEKYSILKKTGSPEFYLLKIEMDS